MRLMPPVAALAAAALAACNPAPSDDGLPDQDAQAPDAGATFSDLPPGQGPTAPAAPTKVEPVDDAHARAGEAVPRGQARPGETPPEAKGGY